MGSISLRNVGVLAANPLFQNLNLVIGEGDRIGLVAANGAGKSTLLKCLAGLAEPTSGEIVRSRGLRIGLVEQEVPVHLLDLSLREVLHRALDPEDRDGQDWRIDMVLDEFETPADLRERPMRALSGGWQRLALIARAWIAEPDLLLLDEPTNHLDLAKLFWLETWIGNAGYRAPVVVASHDRDFLDACTTKTLFLRPGESVSFAHPYRRARALLDAHDAAAQAQQEKTLKEVKRLRQSAQELRNVGINSGSDAAQVKSAQMKRRAEALEQGARALHQERPGEIRLASRGTHARVLVRIENVVVATPDGRGLFTIPRLEVAQQDRIVVLGRNGAGKSQLVRLLHRAATEPDSVPGIRVSPSLAPGYVDQDMSQLPERTTAHDFILSRFRLGDQRSRAVLAEAGFSIERQGLPIGKLSLGQKARLGLLALRLSYPNVYLLDEPTNHVDIPGREQLEAEILDSDATCIVASHDRSFVNSIGTRFLLIDRGRIREIDGPEVFYETMRG
ncbi:ABC-F family ATP-binding cassette domain-containing protein [Microvirga subterranea]|uniref:ATPase subunit of ABC transporter with duplicated ATPase domains n=1 Tax=Microvirga subterranea TaxID=186651 RepID=A0A370HUP1_9HYPH|nr:ABC-F family ATP-binding cassette domain-containing protein [Microvirga subterranea]RDI62227.1 ATPase subunit of ABC transporter with duplicated ATPase domains [Microvirga subterranea]